MFNQIKWSDVSFFTLHNPELIINKIRSLGFNIPKMTIVKIPIKNFNSNSMLWMYNEEIENGKIDPNDLFKFENIDLINTNELPIKTEEYLSECSSMNERPMLFVHIPHLLSTEIVSLNKSIIQVW